MQSCTRLCPYEAGNQDPLTCLVAIIGFCNVLNTLKLVRPAERDLISSNDLQWQTVANILQRVNVLGSCTVLKWFIMLTSCDFLGQLKIGTSYFYIFNIV